MGLAEPRKRIKLSHDPRNTQWTSDTASFGHRYMLSSGWTPGTALGASSIAIPASESSAAKVRIAVKDDTLGLGASLKSRNVEHQRTGLDAFQGLLGRLNAKDANEVAAVEQKIENKKLAMFALGRWGGMTFVPGGKLVQDDPTKKKPTETEVVVEVESTAAPEEMNRIDEKKRKKKPQDVGIDVGEGTGEDSETSGRKTTKATGDETPEERLQRKADKRRRKEERQLRREAKRLKKLKKLKDDQHQSGTDTPISDTSLTNSCITTGTSTPVQAGDKMEQKLNVTAITQQRLSNGRHLLRGRNIQAKRLAFSDAKGLDQIFMKQAQQMQA